MKRNGTERSWGLGLTDLCRQVPIKEQRWWEPVGRRCCEAREPVLGGVGTSSRSTAAGKVGLPHRAWANSFVLFSGHFSSHSETVSAEQLALPWWCELCLSQRG